MIKYTLIIAAFFLTLSSSGQSSIRPDAPIEKVTVFLNGAQVTRQANAKLVKGDNTVVFEGLTGGLDPNSIQVLGNPAYLITGVKYQQQYLDQQTLSKPIQAKKDSLAEVEFKIETNRAMHSVYNEELELLKANRSIKGNDAALLVEDIEEMAEFWRDRVKEIQFRTIELNDEQKELNQTLQRLRRELSKLDANRNKNTSRIEVSLRCQSPGTHAIELSYLVYGAGWIPVYDLRAKDTSSPISVTYKGKVRQSTGVDWEGVELTLSSGNPAAGGVPPYLNPWNLRLRQSYNSNQLQKSAYPQTYGSYEPESDAAMDVALAEGMVSVSENLILTEFTVNLPYDVASDNQFVEVETNRFDLPSDYAHYSVPKLEESAYLRAGVTNWMEYNMLPGEAMIYFQGTYVGKSYISPTAGEDTLQLSLGRDPGVLVKREQLKEYCKTSTFGMKKRTTKAYAIVVRNTKSTPMKIILEDQIPISNNSDIEVEVEELSGGSLDSETGKVIWEVDIPAGQEITKALRFSVKYPKKQVIDNL